MSRRGVIRPAFDRRVAIGGLTGGDGYIPDTAALISAMNNKPTAARMQLIDSTIRDLISTGVWSNLRALYLLAAADEQAARLNWIGPGPTNLSTLNSPTFETDRGYTGDGVTSSLTGGSWSGLITQDSCSAGFWSRTDAANNNYYDLGQTATGTGTQVRINARTAGGNMDGRMADQTSGAFAVADSVGLFAINRSGAALRQFYKNGAEVGNDAAVSTGTTSAMSLLRTQTLFSTRQLAAAFVGLSLTPTQHASLYSILNTYMTAVGA